MKDIDDGFDPKAFFCTCSTRKAIALTMILVEALVVLAVAFGNVESVK